MKDSAEDNVEMQTSIKLTVNGFDDPCYIVDKEAKIVDYNDAYAELIGAEKSDLVGRKISDTKLYFNHKIEQGNLQFMAQGKTDYKFELESYYDPSGRLGDLVLQSHKMLIYDGDRKVIGMLCRVKLTEGNNKLELQLKECLNALKGYVQFLMKEDCFLGQLDAIEGAKAISDSMASISMQLLGRQSLPFWERVYKRTKANDIARYFFYKALIIYDEISSDLMVALQSSYYLQFDITTHKDLMKQDDMLLSLENGEYQIIITNIIDPKLALLTKNTSSCYFGIRTESNAIHPSLATTKEIEIVKKLRMDELVSSIDDNVFKPWREYIVQMIKARIAKEKYLKILYVEDDENSRVSFERLISICPYVGDAQKGECISVSTPVEALTAVKHNVFDIIVVDIGLPEMDGFELAVQIRQLQWQQNNIACPIYGYTGHLIEAEELNYQACGVDWVFLKPELAIDINRVIRDFVPEEMLI
ncbi:response regulator [Cysteiniphilum sp. JM-1]|uniref:response regulator n=1 Tax=Cysteiniphilum sp. JM-1 TaxID=2610891 RepID=UPI001246084A|nr:response regulator [Cysteiniphilum sp. JM-1]